MAQKRAKRFPLLVYKVVVRRWRWPAFLLIPAGIALWWILGRNKSVLDAWAWLPLVISAVGLLVFLYTLLADGACIRCRERYFTLQTPLYPIVFSYRRVQAVRPVDFAKIRPPEEEKPARWRLYRHLWGQTAVAIDLRGYPLSKRWLRIWCHEYLFQPTSTGLLVLTDDWMGLIRQIEIHRTQLKQRRRQA